MWISVEELAGTWASQTEGYTYVGAYADSSHNAEVRWLKGYTERVNEGVWWPDWNTYVRWAYSSRQDQPNANENGQSIKTLYIVFDKVADTEVNPSLTITDNVSTEGTLEATYSGSGSGLYYVWEKSADGSDWRTITRLKMNGDQYNVSEDGRLLNAALEVVNDESDSGGQWFRVSAYESEQAYSGGQQALEVSGAMQLNYYDELRNGDFESPDVQALGTTNSNYQFPVGSDGLIWNTTGADRQVEIVNDVLDLSDNSSDYNNNYGAVEDDGVGEQYAELNCQAAGALYQDVLTVPGTSLNWQFYHRGREGQDTMYLVIAPADQVREITTQGQLENLISRIQYGDLSDVPGYYVYTASDENSSWAYHGSSVQGDPYSVPSEQYLTRFFFVAGDTASKNNTIGNLLDDVRFTTDLLDPVDGTANMRVTKVVNGLDDEAIDDYQVSVSVSGQTNDGMPINKSVTIDNFVEQSDGAWIGYADVTGLPVVANTETRLTVTEDAPDDVTGYDYLGSTVTVDEETVSGVSGSLVVSEGDSGTVSFTNTYESTAQLGLSVKKTDSAGKPLQGARFALYEDGGDGEYHSDVDILAAVTSAEDGGETLTEAGFKIDDSTSAATFYGLKPGVTYWIVETFVPAGYELSDPYRLVINDDGDAATLYGSDGTMIGAEWAIKPEDGLFCVGFQDTLADLEIPETGGNGNVPLYVLGAATVAGSVVMTRRRFPSR